MLLMTLMINDFNHCLTWTSPDNDNSEKEKEKYDKHQQNANAFLTTRPETCSIIQYNVCLSASLFRLDCTYVARLQ